MDIINGDHSSPGGDLINLVFHGPILVRRKVDVEELLQQQVAAGLAETCAGAGVPVAHIHGPYLLFPVQRESAVRKALGGRKADRVAIECQIEPAVEMTGDVLLVVNGKD